MRTKLYCKALTTNQETDKEAGRSMDMLIKKMVKNNKCKRQKTFIEQLENVQSNELGTI